MSSLLAAQEPCSYTWTSPAANSTTSRALCLWMWPPPALLNQGREGMEWEGGESISPAPRLPLKLCPRRRAAAVCLFQSLEKAGSQEQGGVGPLVPSLPGWRPQDGFHPVCSAPTVSDAFPSASASWPLAQVLLEDALQGTCGFTPRPFGVAAQRWRGCLGKCLLCSPEWYSWVHACSFSSVTPLLQSPFTGCAWGGGGRGAHLEEGSLAGEPLA